MAVKSLQTLARSIKFNSDSKNDLYMDSILEKSFDRPRSLLFGLLQSCLFSGYAKDSCPLLQLRNRLSLEEKYDYVMELSAEEVHNILKQHEECYEKRVLATIQG